MPKAIMFPYSGVGNDRLETGFTVGVFVASFTRKALQLFESCDEYDRRASNRQHQRNRQEHKRIFMEPRGLTQDFNEHIRSFDAEAAKGEQGVRSFW